MYRYYFRNSDILLRLLHRFAVFVVLTSNFELGIASLSSLSNQYKSSPFSSERNALGSFHLHTPLSKTIYFHSHVPKKKKKYFNV